MLSTCWVCQLPQSVALSLFPILGLSALALRVARRSLPHASHEHVAILGRLRPDSIFHRAISFPREVRRHRSSVDHSSRPAPLRLAVRAEDHSNSARDSGASENQARRRNRSCQTGRPDASAESPLPSSPRLPSPASHRVPSFRTEPIEAGLLT